MYQILLTSTWYHRVLLGFTGFYQVLPSFTEFLSRYTEIVMIPLFHRVTWLVLPSFFTEFLPSFGLLLDFFERIAYHRGLPGFSPTVIELSTEGRSQTWSTDASFGSYRVFYRVLQRAVKKRASYVMELVFNEFSSSCLVVRFPCYHFENCFFYNDSFIVFFFTEFCLNGCNWFWPTWTAFLFFCFHFFFSSITPPMRVY